MSGLTRLLEREAEIGALEDALASARSGAGRIVLVEGPAGIGKTSLLKAGRELAEPSMRVLHGRGTELERDYPMGSLVSAWSPRSEAPASASAC